MKGFLVIRGAIKKNIIKVEKDNKFLDPPPRIMWTILNLRKDKDHRTPLHPIAQGPFIPCVSPLK